MSLAEPSIAEMEDAPRRRLRILLLIKGLDAGGTEMLLSMMARGRDRRGFDYEAAYLLPWKHGLVKALEAEGVPVHCLDGGKEWDLRWAGRLRRLVRDRGYDVVHVHSPYVAGVGRVALRSLPASVRPRVVYTEHLPWWGYVWPTRLLNQLTYRLDDKTMAVSGSVRDSVAPPLRRRVEVVTHGILPEHVQQQLSARDDVRAELGIGRDELLVGTVAHLRRQKGYPVLLEAARRVIDLGLPVRFVAVGRGPEESEIHSIYHRLDLGERFLFTGFRSDATRVMSAFDIFVLASWYEGLPVTVMEALTLGIPTVATNVGGTPEMITSGTEGLLVHPGRPDELATAIASLAGDPDLRREMRRAAVQRASSFDIEIARRKVEAIYRSVITSPSSVPIS
jgi:glycosyltransferase involved in cell wall biosynthesis